METRPSDPVMPLPPLSIIGMSREILIAALMSEGYLLRAEAAVATIYAGEIEGDILALIERARREELDGPSQQLLFRGIHILSARRLAAAYRPFLALLREADRERLENLLGDATAETLARLIAGLYDGDPEPLETLIADASVDEFVRGQAVGAFAFLTFEGRIERARSEEFLERLERENDAPPGDLVWHGWMCAVGLLGVERLRSRVHAAFRDGRIPQWVTSETDFHELLRAAQERPGDRERFERDDLGYIEDVCETLMSFDPVPDEDDEDDGFEAELSEVTDAMTSKMLSEWPAPSTPERNPHRDVGRNDPCPCGSGKKFKRCCMP